MYTKNPRNHQTSTKKSFNLPQFIDKFFNNITEQIEFIMKLRFPEGYVCDDCGNTEYRWLEKKKVCQCTRCYDQTYLLAGTIFQDSKLSFYKLLLGIYIFTTNQSGINGSTLALYMGVNVNTARLFLKKLRTACEMENQQVILDQLIDFDGAYLGGVDTGGKRGLGSNKQTVLVGVEMIQVTNSKGITKEYPGRARTSLARSENKDEIIEFMKKGVKQGTIIRSDAGKGISVLSQICKDVDGSLILDADGNTINKYPYELHAQKFDEVDNNLEFVHKFISNLKSLLLGTYHGVNLQYIDLYIDEFTWRFNHRVDNNNLIKVKSLLRSVFNTAVCTAKDFKNKYSATLDDIILAEI